MSRWPSTVKEILEGDKLSNYLEGLDEPEPGYYAQGPSRRVEKIGLEAMQQMTALRETRAVQIYFQQTDKPIRALTRTQVRGGDARIEVTRDTIQYVITLDHNNETLRFDVDEDGTIGPTAHGTFSNLGATVIDFGDVAEFMDIARIGVLRGIMDYAMEKERARGGPDRNQFR